MANFEDLDLLKIGNSIQIAGAIWVGDHRTYLVYFPGEEPEINWPMETLEMTSEQWELFLRQTDIMEVEVLAAGADGKVTKAIIRKSARQIAQHISWAVYRRDEFKCRYCAADEVPLTVDHLVLWEDGGPSTEANLVAACRKCNKARGNTSYGDWLHHPHYKAKSANLSEAVRLANEALLPTLADIPRMVHKQKKRK